MLGEQLEFKIKYSNKEISLNFTIRALKNIHTLVGYSAFEYLSKFLTCNNEEKTIYISQLLYCITDGELDIFDILTNLLVDDSTISRIYNGLINLIQLELKNEIEEEKEDNEEQEETKELTLEEKNKGFIRFYNDMLYFSTVKLNKTKEEFLNMTVRELKTLQTIDREYNKNILLDTYITVLKSKTKEDKKELEIITEKSNVRLKDLFAR